MTLDTKWAKQWIDQSHKVLDEHREELTTLDREIGDADHGENMSRGFGAVVPAIADVPDNAPIGDVLKVVAKTLISTVGGAAGPLYGTAFLKAAGATKDAKELDAAGVVAMLDAAKGGIQLRGKAEVGDKTMVDAWQPAVDAAKAAADAGQAPEQVLAAAAKAARAGAESTIPLVAHKGRASYLGERAIGHQDPGATSTALILETAEQASK